MEKLQNILFFVNNNYYTVFGKKKEEAMGMATALNYQLSILGRYSISPAPEVITTLMAKINETAPEIFLPNIINIQQIEIPTNRVITNSHLGFVTQDQKYSIALLNDRIDVNYNKLPNSEVEMKDFYFLAEKVLSTIMQSLNLNSNRLAINIQMILEMESFTRMGELGKRLLKSAEYYNDKAFCEWSTRINAQTTAKILDVDEKVNTITDISTAQSVQGDKAAVMYHIDVNTLPQNTDMRFAYSALMPFVENILPIVTKIANDAERLITND